MSRSSSRSNSPENKIGVKKLKRFRNELFQSQFGYTNEENPFNDAEIDLPFKWKKKIEKEGTAERMTASQFYEKSKNQMEEIQRVRERRAQYEQERKEIQHKRDEEFQEAEMAKIEIDEKKEKMIVLYQTQLKSRLRIREGRETPADLLAKSLLFSSKVDFEYSNHRVVDRPIEEFLKNLPTDRLKSCLQEVAAHTIAAKKNMDELYHELFQIGSAMTSEGLNKIVAWPCRSDFEEYWKCLSLLIKQELLDRENEEIREVHEKQKIAQGDYTLTHQQLQEMFSERERMLLLKAPSQTAVSFVSSSILNDIKTLLKKKNTPEEYSQLQIMIEKKLLTLKGDRSYWNALLELIPIFRALCLVRQVLSEGKEQVTQILVQKRKEQHNTDDTQDFNEAKRNPNHDGQYSPVLYPQSPPELQHATLLLQDDLVPLNAQTASAISQHEKALEEQRKASYEEFKKIAEANQREMEHERIYREYIEKETKYGDKDFDILQGNSEVSVLTQRKEESGEMSLEEAMKFDAFKSAPVGGNALVTRKPRYFNRVKTGYEWNKYNQVHYDYDNPPPKTVQGYKFMLFYFDLLDMRNIPRYRLEPSDSPDTVIIRFIAGAPYEDIAFKIVNREWDKRNNFYCTFERGVLQLNFMLKRQPYRK